jgi:hypothetical protein
VKHEAHVVKLITEQDLQDGRLGDPIVIDAETAITPSALDRAALLGLRVVFARERGVAPHHSQSAALPVVELPDGQYLVHVNRGQTRIFRLTPTGPVPVDS